MDNVICEKLKLITQEIEKIKTLPADEIKIKLIDFLIAIDLNSPEEKKEVESWIEKRGYALDLGIDPALLILEYEQALDKKRKEQGEEARKKQVTGVQKKIKQINEAFTTGKITEDNYSQEIGKAATNLKTILTRGKEPQPITNEEIDKQEEKEGIVIPLLNDLMMQYGTIIYIGGRPGHGKTLLQINFAIDLLLRGHSIEFFTYEESAKRLFYKMLICLHYSRNKGNLQSLDFSFISNRFWGYYKSPLKSLIGSSAEKKFPPDYIIESREMMRKWIDTGKLKIYDRPGDYIQLAQLLLKNPEAIAFLDYIQKVPGNSSITNRQAQIQQVSGHLLDTVVKSNKMLFSGAQFNRMNEKSRGTQPENSNPLDYPDVSSYDLDKFREAGDIEQDANIALGIKAIKVDEYWRKCSIKILKNRDGESALIINLDHQSLFWHLEKVNNGNQSNSKLSADPQEDKNRKDWNTPEFPIES